MTLVGSRKGKTTCPCQYVQYRTVVGRQRWIEVLAGSRGECCRDFAACNAGASQHRRVRDMS